MRAVLFFFFSLLACSIYAQNLSQYSLSFVDRLIYNPGYSGRKDINVFLHHRSQNVGLSPINFSNQTFLADIPINKLNSGLGFEVHNDFAGFLSNTSMDLKLAYHGKINSSHLSIGFSVGAIYQTLNQSKLTVSSGEYNGFVVHNDALLDTINSSSFQFNSSVGLVYSIRQFDLGIGLLNLNNPKTDIFRINSFEQNRVMVGNLSYNFIIGKSINYEVYCLYKTDFVKHQLELSNIIKINSIILTGLTLRGYNKNNFDAIGIFFGINFLKNFWVYYNYDIPVNSLPSSNYGSHELVIQFKKAIKKKDLRRHFVNYNSRYL